LFASPPIAASVAIERRRRSPTQRSRPQRSEGRRRKTFLFREEWRPLSSAARGKKFAAAVASEAIEA
jgi:hypothetical protein